jgi:hypothetical protein
MTDIPSCAHCRGLEHKVEARARRRRLRHQTVLHAELVARVQAALRRAGPASDTVEHLTDGPLVVDLRSKIVHLDGEPVALSPTEWNLLVTFLRHRGQVLSPEQLLEQAWADPTGVGPNVKFAVRLRRRMGGRPRTSPIGRPALATSTEAPPGAPVTDRTRPASTCEPDAITAAGGRQSVARCPWLCLRDPDEKARSGRLTRSIARGVAGGPSVERHHGQPSSRRDRPLVRSVGWDPGRDLRRSSSPMSSKSSKSPVPQSWL